MIALVPAAKLGALSAYAAAAIVAVISDNISSAVIAGVFGLVGVVLQLTIGRRTKRTEDTAVAAAERSAENRDLLHERAEEIATLRRRVEQLMGILDRRTGPDSRAGAADAAETDQEKRDRR